MNHTIVVWAAIAIAWVLTILIAYVLGSRHAHGLYVKLAQQQMSYYRERGVKLSKM